MHDQVDNMWYFTYYETQRSASFLKISADAVLEFDRSDFEDVQIGTPKWWDEYVASRIDFEKYDLYLLYSTIVSGGNYNAITDYKAVWELCNIEKGFYDNHYQIGDDRVYIGIQKTSGQSAFLGAHASFVIVQPKAMPFDAKRVYSLLSENAYRFDLADDACYQTLLSVYQLCDDSFLLKYTTFGEHSLMLFGKHVENWFDSDSIQEHKGAQDVAYHGY